MPNKLDALFRPVDNSWLVIFRIAFGLLMTEEAVRYLVFGFATGLYVEPRFHFQYYGFTWVEPWSGIGMYVHFAVLVVLGLMITFGLYYRVAATLFFFGFTYVFLLDQARYLNHFYLVVLLAFWMIFLPAHRTLSLDARRRPDFRREVAPAWTLWLFRAQLGVVYVYAAVAKMNMDWLSAEPLRMWLSEKDRTQKPIIGPLLAREETAWVMSYGGLLLDLLCVPFLLWRRTRIFAFLAVLSFHAINYLVFSIGIFPWLMLASTRAPQDRTLPSGGAARADAAVTDRATDDLHAPRALRRDAAHRSAPPLSLSRRCQLDRGGPSLLVAHEAA